MAPASGNPTGAAAVAIIDTAAATEEEVAAAAHLVPTTATTTATPHMGELCTNTTPQANPIVVAVEVALERGAMAQDMLNRDGLDTATTPLREGMDRLEGIVATRMLRDIEARDDMVEARGTMGDST